MKVLVTQSCPTLCDPMDCSPPGSSVHGILQARILESFPIYLDFPGSSANKESACNLGDSGLIPGSERSPGKWMGYPLQYSWASLVVQMVKNLPAMLETWVWSQGWEDPLEEGMATHSSILAWRIPWSERVGLDWATKPNTTHTHIHTHTHINNLKPEQTSETNLIRLLHNVHV